MTEQDELSRTGRRNFVLPSGARVRYAALALVVLLAGVTIFAGAEVANYEPMQTGLLFAVGPVEAVSRTFDSSSGESVYALTYHGGRGFTVEFDLFNQGPVGVTVASIAEYENIEVLPFPTVEMSVANEVGNGGVPKPIYRVPFHAFALAPGHFRWVKLHFLFRNCETDDSLGSGKRHIELGALNLRFRVAGIPRTQFLQLSGPVMIDTSGVRCWLEL